MCTYKDCMLSAKSYGSRKAWWEHETQRHRTQRAWICTPCERRHLKSVFHTSISFETHIGNYHSVGLTPVQMPNIRDMCQKDVSRQPPRDTCPLCNKTIPVKSKSSVRAAERAVRKHVSDHMEQLAFFVASSAGQMAFKDDDSEFQDDSEFEDGLQSEIKTIASRDTPWSKKDTYVANLKAFIADQQKAAEDVSNITTPAASPPEATHVDHRDSTQTQNLGIEVQEFPVHVQLPPPNEHFYSRSNLLLDLDKCLSSSGAMCIVHGVGGVGKTLAAVQYSHVHKEQYDAIFWLQADTAPGLTDSYLRMAVALGVADSPDDHHLIMAKGRNWLQETGKIFWCKYALSFRLADDVRETLAAYLRQRHTLGRYLKIHAQLSTPNQRISAHNNAKRRTTSTCTEQHQDPDRPADYATRIRHAAQISRSRCPYRSRATASQRDFGFRWRLTSSYRTCCRLRWDFRYHSRGAYRDLPGMAQADWCGH